MIYVLRSFNVIPLGLYLSWNTLSMLIDILALIKSLHYNYVDFASTYFTTAL